MARMIPATIHPDVRSGGERRIFALLREARETNNWICLHSLGLARHAYKRRAEIDFLVISGNRLPLVPTDHHRVFSARLMLLKVRDQLRDRAPLDRLEQLG